MILLDAYYITRLKIKNISTFYRKDSNCYYLNDLFCLTVINTNMETCHPNFSIPISPEVAIGYLYNNYHKTLILGVVPVLILIGFVGNLGFLFVILKIQYMRTITNFYLGNLAVADLSLIITMAINIMWSYSNSQVTFDKPYRSSAGCVLYIFFIYLPFFASTSLVTLVTMERYIAICKPLYHRMVSNKVRSVKFVIVSWTIASIFAALYTPGEALVRYVCVKWPDGELYENVPSEIYFCASKSDLFDGFGLYAQAIPFWFALIVNMAMSCMIIRKLNYRKFSTAAPVQRQTDTTRNQVAKMLIANNVAFFLCLGPLQIYNIFNILYWHTGHTPFTYYELDTWLWMARVTGVANSAINPIIYNATNQRYRVAFAKCFGCDAALRKPQMTSYISGGNSSSTQIPKQRDSCAL